MALKALVLLAVGMVLGFGSVAARADSGVFFTIPLIHGPSGFRQRNPPPTRTPMQPMPTRERDRAAEHAQPAVGPGEPDETGRIGPTVPSERDADGKLLPTHRPR